jgi:hypothetical protein
MTFEQWWKENEKLLLNHIRLQEWTYIKQDYEAAWHDGWRIGFELAKNKGGGNEHPLHTQ